MKITKCITHHLNVNFLITRKQSFIETLRSMFGLHSFVFTAWPSQILCLVKKDHWRCTNICMVFFWMSRCFKAFKHFKAVMKLFWTSQLFSSVDEIIDGIWCGPLIAGCIHSTLHKFDTCCTQPALILTCKTTLQRQRQKQRQRRLLHH